MGSPDAGGGGGLPRRAHWESTGLARSLGVRARLPRGRRRRVPPTEPSRYATRRSLARATRQRQCLTLHVYPPSFVAWIALHCVASLLQQAKRARPADHAPAVLVVAGRSVLVCESRRERTSASPTSGSLWHRLRRSIPVGRRRAQHVSRGGGGANALEVRARHGLVEGVARALFVLLAAKEIDARCFARRSACGSLEIVTGGVSGGLSGGLLSISEPQRVPPHGDRREPSGSRGGPRRSASWPASRALARPFRRRAEPLGRLARNSRFAANQEA